MVKKVILLLLPLFLLSLTACSCTGFDRFIPSTEGISYGVSADGTYAEVLGYSGSANKIKIANTYNGLPVTTISDSAFAACSNLTSVTIPDSVTTIGERVFVFCSNLTSITVDPDNEYYQSIDGNLYSKDGKTLIQYAAGKTETAFIIPDGVNIIGNGAFYKCTNLTSITVDPDNEYYQSIDGDL